MIQWILLGVQDDWCNDFLQPPHMPWWLGRGLGKMVGCWGNESESMMPLLLVVIAFAVWHVTVARKHLRMEKGS